MIPISKPYFNSEILKYAHDAIDSTWVGSIGKYLTLAEDALEKVTNTYVLLTNNGTSSTHLVANTLKTFIGKENIAVPDNCYVAAWNSLLLDRYYFIKPIETDINTWNFDLAKLSEDSPKIVLCVHNLGNIIPIEDIKLTNTIFVEDNCEGFHKNYALHEKSFCGSVSFYGNKILTCGEGGAFLTRDGNVYDYAKKYRGQGQTDEKFIHDIPGNNYRMTNIQAALLFGQLKYLDEISERREQVFYNYLQLIKNTNLIPQRFKKHSYWMFGVRVIGNTSYQKLRDYMELNGVETRPMFYPISAHKHLRVYSSEKECVSTLLNKECVILPTYPELTYDEQKQIIEVLLKYVP